MMRYQKQIHAADWIVWSHQLRFLLFGEVTQVEKSELAECRKGPERISILAVVHGPIGFTSTKRIRLPRTRQCMSNVLSIGRQHDNAESFYMDVSARLRHDVLGPSNHFLIGLIVFSRDIGIFPVRPVIN